MEKVQSLKIDTCIIEKVERFKTIVGRIFVSFKIVWAEFLSRNWNFFLFQKTRIFHIQVEIIYSQSEALQHEVTIVNG